MKIKTIEKVGLRKTYDLTVERNHNFLLGAGVFAHNSELRELYVPRSEDTLLGHYDYCWHKDTKIKLLSGEILTIAQLETLHKEKQLYTYSHCMDDSQDVKLHFGTVKNVWKTRKVSHLHEITLDNGFILRMTDNHKLYLRTGEVKEVKDLIEGDRLMSLYTSTDSWYAGGGYECYQISDECSARGSGNWNITHKTIEYKAGKLVEGNICHHVNGIMTDNSPDNLSSITQGEHFSTHLNECYEDPEYYKRHCERASEYMNRPEVRDEVSKRSTAMWNDPVTRATMEEGFTRENKLRALESVKLLLNNGHTVEELDSTYTKDYNTLLKKYKNKDRLQRGEGKRFFEIHFEGKISKFIDSLPAGSLANHQIKEIKIVPYDDWVYQLEVSEDFHNYFVLASDDGSEMILSKNSAMEVRSLASISGDEGLLEAFRKGYDIHRYNASMIYKKDMVDVTDAERRNAKLSCVTGDTLIKLMDGTSKPIKDLAGMSDFWVYSLDQLTGKFVPGFVKECYRTKTTDKLAYVTLDNGSVVKCTPDHEFLLRDGSYVEAQNLSSGDSLAALYTKLSTGEEGLGVSKNYELIQDLDGRWELTHRRVVQSVPVRKGVISGKEVVVIHHCDFTKYNNTPENLIVTDFSNHGELHGSEQVSRVESVVDDFMTDEFKSRPDYRNGHESLESYVAGEISRRWRRCYNYDDMSGKDKALAETASTMMNDKTFLTLLKTELDKQSIIKAWESHTTSEYLSRISGLVTWSDERRKSKSEEMLEDNKNWWTSRSRNANINKAAYLIKDLIHAGLDPSKEYNNYRSNSLVIRWENLPSELGITYDKLIEYAKGSKHFPRPIKLLDTTKQSESGVARMEHLWNSDDQDAVEFRERHSVKQSKMMTGLNSDEETKLAQARGKCLKSLKLMINAVGFDNVTEETYDELRWKLVELKLTVSSTNTPTLNRVKVLFESLDEAKEKALTYNHSVVSVKIVDEECDVYDLAVDGYRNYVIDLGDGSGVAVENTFGILYGQTAEAFAAEHLKGDVATAKKLFADFYIAFPKVGAWIKRMHELAAANNEVPTIFGNVLKLDPSNYNTMLRTAQNFPIQSSSSNVAGESIWLLYVTAMIRNITFIPQVFTHDSCDFEFNTKDLFSIIDLMQEVAVDNLTAKYNLIVKIDWEVGNSQSDTFELKLLNKAEDDSERTFEFSCNDRAYEPTLTKLRKFFDLEVVLSKRESKLQPLAEMWVVRRAFSKYLGEYVDAIKGTITLKKKL